MKVLLRECVLGFSMHIFQPSVGCLWFTCKLSLVWKATISQEGTYRLSWVLDIKMWCLALSSLLQHHPVENLGTLLSFQISRKAAWHTGKDVPSLIYLFPPVGVFPYSRAESDLSGLWWGQHEHFFMLIIHLSLLVISVLRSASPRLIAYATAGLGAFVSPLNKWDFEPPVMFMFLFWFPFCWCHLKKKIWPKATQERKDLIGL